MKKQEEKTKTLGEVMKTYGATLTVPFREGYASISINDEKELTVEFLNEEGYHYDGETPIELRDLEKVTNFMAEIKALKLPEYKSV